MQFPGRSPHTSLSHLHTAPDSTSSHRSQRPKTNDNQVLSIAQHHFTSSITSHNSKWSLEYWVWAFVPGRYVHFRAFKMNLTNTLKLICAVIVTAMAGNNIARATNGTHSIINYTLFVGVWWLFTLLYFLPTSFIDKFAIPIVDMAFDGLSVLFGYCAAVALPAYLGAHSCSNRVRHSCD